MNEQARSIFLCPDCGGLSAATGEGRATCQDCQKEFPVPDEVVRTLAPRAIKARPDVIQRNVVPKNKDLVGAFKTVEKIPQQPAEYAELEELQKEGGTRRRRKLKKRSKPSPKVYLGWLLLWSMTVAIILFVVSRLQQEFGDTPKDAMTIEERLVGEEKEFYRTEYPRIFKNFRRFLVARSQSEMAEMVLSTSQVERKMSRHLKGNSIRRAVTGLKPNPVFWNVAFEETPGFVEVVWDGGQSGSFEGVFIKVGDEWRIDWEQFARYDSENWTLFRQNLSSQKSGLFRVYLQKISEGANAEFEPWLKVRILPSYEDERRRDLEASEPILLEGDGQIATAISNLFLDKSGQSKGYSELWKREDDDLRRALLRLEWETDAVTGEENLVIQEVLASHWRSLDFEAGERDDSESRESEEEK